MRKKGLTLVELLIVIAIIVALAGLLFPVFTSVRERARIIYCVNNLKQVGTALHLYAQDYDGFVPPYTNLVPFESTQPYCPNKAFLFPNSWDPTLFENAYNPYTKNRQIWFCPLDPFAGMDTPEPPRGFGPPTWAGFYWNDINHKATSYIIPDEYAFKGIAPVHISSPPPWVECVIINDKLIGWKIGGPEDGFENAYYAFDFTHTTPELQYPLTSIVLFLSNEVKVRRR